MADTQLKPLNDPSQLSDADLLRMLDEPNRDTPPRITGVLPDSPARTREAAASTAADEPSDPLIGLGSLTQRIINGGAQGFLKAKKAFSPGDRNIDTAISDLVSEQTDNSIRDKAYAKQNPWAMAVGESLPTLPVGVANVGKIAPGSTRGLEGLDLWNAVKGAIPGAVSYGSADERAMNAGIGGVATGLGSFLGRVAGKYVNPDLSPIQRETLREGRARDIYPRLSQVTKSPTIEGIEDTSSVVPIGRGINAAFDRRNSQGFNQVAGESMGQRTDAAGQISPEVFAAAKRDIPRPFQAVDALNGLPIEVDQNVAAAAGNVLHRQTLRLTPDGTLSDIAQQALHAAQNGGRMSGESYQALRSELTNAKHAAFSAGDGKTGTDYSILLDALDGAADTSLRRMGRADLADGLQTARDQYGNYKILTGGRVAEGGDVLPSRVATAVRANNPDAFRTGRSTGQPLDFLARWSELFPPQVKGSQTATRAATGAVMAEPLSAMSGALSIPGAIAAKVTTMPSVTTIPARIGGTPLGRAAEVAVEPGIAGLVQSLIRRFMRPQTP